MNCPSCQQVLQEQAHFCSNCGLSTARFHTKTQIIEPQETVKYTHPHDALIGRVLDAKYELIEHLGARNVQATVDTMGASGMQVLRGVEDQKAFDAGKNNMTDARGLLTLFEAIGKGRAVSVAANRRNS